MRCVCEMLCDGALWCHRARTDSIRLPLSPKEEGIQYQGLWRKEIELFQWCGPKLPHLGVVV